MARRLVLNGLTAEAAAAPSAAPAPSTREFYHELELYRQLLALPPPSPLPPSSPLPPTSPPPSPSPPPAICRRELSLPPRASPDDRPASAASGRTPPPPPHTCLDVATAPTAPNADPDVGVVALELCAGAGDAPRMRMAFASHLHAAPLWSKEGRGGMGRAPPHSLPPLQLQYPSDDRSEGSCSTCASSPSSDEAPPGPHYRRLGAGAGGGAGGAGGAGGGALRRLARGLLLPPDDDDSTPLVADTPTTPSTLPLGYVNEAAATARRDCDCDDRDDRDNDCGASSSSCSSRSGNNNRAAPPCAPPAPPPPAAAPLPPPHELEPQLARAPWYQHGLPREIALEVLLGAPAGAFLVRASRSQAPALALSVRVPRGVAHYLVLRAPQHYKIKGFTKEFTTLTALVTHHSVMPELLPLPLRLARPATRDRDYRCDR